MKLSRSTVGLSYPCLFVVAVLIGISLTQSSALAQTAAKGIPSEGRDFYIGYMPNLPIPAPPEPITPEQAWIIVCSPVDNNTFTISYFGDDGKEISGSQQPLMKGRCLQLPLVKTYMAPKRPGELLEFKAAHVTSRFPVSVAVYQEGSAAGGMYEAVPTAGLGKKYVISAWYDCPLQDNPTPPGFADSASSEFMIIATEDNTNVQWTPNSTTIGGIIGMNSGDGSTGQPHTQRLAMRRGQVYWVRSDPNSALNDLTGSSITADKPIAVLGGHEKALLGDPGALVSQWADVRDIMVEEMTPVDAWDSEYVSIPFLPAQSSRASSDGWGDLYRFVTDANNAGLIDAYTCSLGTPNCTPMTKPVGAFQSPATDYNNIEDPEDFIVQTRGADGKLKKMYGIMYDYFQGDNSTDEYAFTAPNEMNLIGLSRMKTSTVFHVPQNSKYQGAQYFNVITTNDSLKANKILMMINGKSPVSLNSGSKRHTYQIPNHSELIGITFLAQPNADYLIYGNTPLACYTYGRTENTIKVSPWGYATPTGMLYGSRDELNPPRADIIPSCDHWDVRVFDDRPGDQGIANILLLNDPDGNFSKPGRISYNVSLSPSNLHYTPGDTSVSFQVVINDTRKNGYAALYFIDRAGNDTVIDLYYTAPRIQKVYGADTMKDNTIVEFKNANVGMPACSTVIVRILNTGSTDSMLFSAAAFGSLDTVRPYSMTAVPSLPAMVHVGDSVVLTLCFNSPDTLKHSAYLPIAVGCLYDTVNVLGNGVTPIIIASDWDFGKVPVGTTSAPHSITIQNVGNGDLVLDKNWKGLSNTDFAFVNSDQLPVTIQPRGVNNTLKFTFHPSVKGPSDTRIDWGTNIGGKYAHMIKDTSHLSGFGTEPGLNWDRAKQQFTVKCEAKDTERVFLKNPTFGATGSLLHITSVKVEGTDASEFKIIDDALGYIPFEAAAWDLSPDDSIWVNIQFNPDLSAKQYAGRSARIVAVGHDDAQRPYSDTLSFNGIIRHSDLAVNPSSYDFGPQDPKQQFTHSFVLTNNGDTDFVFTTLDLVGPDFQIVSGPKQGDLLAPGASDTLVLQYNSPEAGGPSQATISFVDGSGLCSKNGIFSKGYSGDVILSQEGHDYDVNYICNGSSATLTASTRGLYGAILDSVVIISDATHPDADQFTFAKSGGNSTGYLQQPVDSLNPAKFDIKFTPTRQGKLGAVLLYYWLDTSKGKHLPILKTEYLAGLGFKTENTLSLKNPVANEDYSTTTSQMLTIPVQLVSAFADTAKVFGAKFTVRYLRDQFRLPDAGGVTEAMAGVTIVGTPQVQNDISDTKYDLIPIEVRSTSPITQAGTLVNIKLQYMLAKDTTTEFQIKDLTFLGNNQASVCWVAADTIPAQFFGLNVCGDKTLRIFLRTGGKAISNIHVSPNPIRYEAQMNYDVEESGTPVTIEVFNALGQNVQTIMEGQTHEKGRYTTTVDAMHLPSGMYTIRIVSPGCEVAKSVMISK
jgi:hypothetical protein